MFLAIMKILLGTVSRRETCEPAKNPLIITGRGRLK